MRLLARDCSSAAAPLLTAMARTVPGSEATAWYERAPDDLANQPLTTPNAAATVAS